MALDGVFTNIYINTSLHIRVSHPEISQINRNILDYSFHIYTSNTTSPNARISLSHSIAAYSPTTFNFPCLAFPCPDVLLFLSLALSGTGLGGTSGSAT